MTKFRLNIFDYTSAEMMFMPPIASSQGHDVRWFLYWGWKITLPICS